MRLQITQKSIEKPLEWDLTFEEIVGKKPVRGILEGFNLSLNLAQEEGILGISLGEIVPLTKAT